MEAELDGNNTDQTEDNDPLEREYKDTVDKCLNILRSIFTDDKSKPTQKPKRKAEKYRKKKWMTLEVKEFTLKNGRSNHRNLI